MSLPPLLVAMLSLSVHGAMPLLFALVIGHFVCDYPLQGTFLAINKNRHAQKKGAPGIILPPLTWVHALTAHSFIHAGSVWLLTGSIWLAVCEVVLHWLIDYAKCEQWIDYNVDQLLHIGCKVLYVVLISYALVS